MLMFGSEPIPQLMCIVVYEIIRSCWRPQTALQPKPQHDVSVLSSIPCSSHIASTQIGRYNLIQITLDVKLNFQFQLHLLFIGIFAKPKKISNYPRQLSKSFDMWWMETSKRPMTAFTVLKSLCLVIEIYIKRYNKIISFLKINRM